MSSAFEAVIGLEVHCQLATETKIFCGCRARLPRGRSVADIAANSNTCPVCAGHPGTLPVLNQKVLEYALKAALATECKINLRNIFARKNYFYPDLPKGYQISQYESPIAEYGNLSIETQTGIARRIEIRRIHMEEDAGKNLHREGFSLVNLNRAGVPLIEIVSGPDLRSADEAGAYLRELYAIVTCLGICDGNLQEGNFRCDANVSIRPMGSERLGTRVEIKNVNSFRFVEKAIDYEIARQIQVVQSGGNVIQETRSYDADRNLTTSMRSKEEAEDYRYFPDPDLIPVVLNAAWVEEIRHALPELPQQKRSRYVSEWGLSGQDARVLVETRSLTELFEESMRILAAAGVDAKAAAKPVANLVCGEILRLFNDAAEGDKPLLRPEHIAETVRLVTGGAISSTGAKQALGIAWRTGSSIDEIVENEGLKQVSDLSALEPTINKIIASFPKQVEEYRSGKDKLLGFFVGQVMKETGGKANPSLLQDLIKQKLS